MQAAISAIQADRRTFVESGSEGARVQATFARAQRRRGRATRAARRLLLAVSFRKAGTPVTTRRATETHQSSVNTPTPQKPIWDRPVRLQPDRRRTRHRHLHGQRGVQDASQPNAIDICTGGTSCPVMPTTTAQGRRLLQSGRDSRAPPGPTTTASTHVAGSIIGSDNVANPGTDCVNFTTPGGDTI